MAADPSPRPPATPVIRGERIYLRPAERSDIPRFVEWFADGEMGRYLGVRAPFSTAMEERWFDEMVANQGKSSYHFVICLLADGRPIGTCGFHHVNFEDGHATFGISIGEKAEWNRGYGTDALNAICDFGFGMLRLERIELDVYAGNARGIRSYEKAGFVPEGTKRRAHFSEGEYWDVHVMALLREDWLRQPRRHSWQYLPEPSAAR